MSVSSNCEICLSGEVEHTCSRCAQLVCDDHYDSETGLCTECVSEVSSGQGDRKRQPPSEDMPDGVDTYRF